jgi:putative FmdB family regulatory protein
MPIYAYRCNACGFEKDHLQKLSDPVLSTCPECSQEAYQKQVTAAGFQLKGQGWYATDFKNNGSAKPAPAKAEAAPACQSCPGADACAAS